MKRTVKLALSVLVVVVFVGTSFTSAIVKDEGNSNFYHNEHCFVAGCGFFVDQTSNDHILLELVTTILENFIELEINHYILFLLVIIYANNIFPRIKVPFITKSSSDATKPPLLLYTNGDNGTWIITSVDRFDFGLIMHNFVGCWFQLPLWRGNGTFFLCALDVFFGFADVIDVYFKEWNN